MANTHSRRMRRGGLVQQETNYEWGGCWQTWSSLLTPSRKQTNRTRCALEIYETFDDLPKVRYISHNISPPKDKFPSSDIFWIIALSQQKIALSAHIFGNVYIANRQIQFPLFVSYSIVCLSGCWLDGDGQGVEQHCHLPIMSRIRISKRKVVWPDQKDLSGTVLDHTLRVLGYISVDIRDNVTRVSMPLNKVRFHILH